MAETKTLAGGGHEVGVDRTERKGKRKKIHKVEVTRAKNGGHVVRHHFISGPDRPFEEPQEHVFGKGEGQALMAHLHKHLGVRDSEAPAEAVLPPDEGEAEAEEQEQ